MNIPSGWELVLVLLVVVLVFGSKRLPDSARSLGRSMRIFKAETKGLHDDTAAKDTAKDGAQHAVVVEPRPLAAPGAAQPRFDPYTGTPLDPAQGSVPPPAPDRQP